MVKQVEILLAKTTDELQQKINEFCVDFFPEEIADIEITKIPTMHNGDEWLGYIIYQKNGY